jgi:hypothetical protein
MALYSRPLIVEGDSWGAVYTFEKAGDVFFVHVHTDDDNHITIQVHGGVRLMGHPDYEGVEVYAKPGGTIIDWEAGKPHGAVALTDGATWVNIKKR